MTDTDSAASLARSSVTSSIVWTMKLTPELLAQASSSINPVKERQLDLRGTSTIRFMIASPTFLPGYKIPAIENIGVTKVRAHDLNRPALW